jgi:ubiquinone/menaquinone biosynthesis C-methylase UbiE
MVRKIRNIATIGLKSRSWISCGLRIEMMDGSQRTYLPAAGYDWALPLYDIFVKLFGFDRAREALVKQAAIQSGHRVLDIGCGTGTLVALLKRLHPDVDVFGIDPDPKALARARRKAAAKPVFIQFDQGFSDVLPYPEASFDRILSSFMFHHLQSTEKEKTLREIRRVLKPGGILYLLDFGGPENRRGGFLAHLIHSDHLLKDNFDSRIIALMSQAGLAEPKVVSHRATVFGNISYYQATAPGSPANESN